MKGRSLEFQNICKMKVGKVAEWSNALVLKTSVLKGTGGSNPSFSAYGGLAQLARALALHARGHRFDSDILHH
jgi:hypothetical protein